MYSDKMREAFEKWAKSGSYNMKRTHDGLYIYPDTASAWHAWQAAHAAALPPGFVAVPVEPTPKMQAEAWAGIEAAGCLGMNYNDAARKVWADMLAARPEVRASLASK